MVRRILCLLVVLVLGASVFVGVLAHANSGAATINPAKVAANNFKTPSASKSLRSSGPFPNLRIINWLPWIVLPVIVWLLVLLIYFCLGLLSENKYQNVRVSTTIS